MLAVGAVFGLIAVREAWRRSARRQALPVIARRAGLDYSEEDRFNCTGVAFPLFRAGDGRTVENVMWRPQTSAQPGAGSQGGGEPVRVFDYGYYDEFKDRNGQVRRSWHHFSCALVQHNGSWPALRVSREGLLDKAEHVLGSGDIDFESEEFNRMFRVQCPDRRFASALIDPQMMEIMLSGGGTVNFETKGRFLLLTARQVPAEAMPRLWALADAVVAHIPASVWELYPRFPDGGGPEVAPELLESAPDLGPAVPGAFDFAPAPDSRHPDEAWDPTPGVDHDLEGHAIEPTPEDPWHDRTD
jgi:hypothetical protein